MLRSANKVILENNRYFLVSLHSNPSNPSNPSKDSKPSKGAENAADSSELTMPYYEVTRANGNGIVTPETLADLPIEPSHSNGNGHLTRVTRLTRDVEEFDL